MFLGGAWVQGVLHHYPKPSSHSLVLRFDVNGRA
jgi:hypothetical protein